MDQDEDKGRLSFGGAVDRLFGWIVLAVATYMANEVGKLTTSVGDLNIKMAAIVEKVSNQDRRIDMESSRLGRIEDSVRTISINHGK